MYAHLARADQRAPDEPPLRFILAQDRARHWVLMEEHGLYGGVFQTKRAAMQFAKDESGARRSTLKIIANPDKRGRGRSEMG